MYMCVFVYDWWKTYAASFFAMIPFFNKHSLFIHFCFLHTKYTKSDLGVSKSYQPITGWLGGLSIVPRYLQLASTTYNTIRKWSYDTHQILHPWDMSQVSFDLEPLWKQTLRLLQIWSSFPKASHTAMEVDLSLMKLNLQEGLLALCHLLAS